MSKERILVFPFNLLSHYLRCIELCRYYSDYEIMFQSSESYDQYIQQNGYRSFKAECFDSSEVMKQANEFRFEWLNEKDLERVYLSQVQVINELNPYLVIGDNSPTLKMAAEASGTKYVALMNGYMSKYYRGIRPVSRSHYSYRYLQQLPKVVSGFMTRLGERAAFKSIHKPFGKLRDKYGLSRYTNYMDELEGDENLICDLPELFPQKVLPENYRTIGPLIYDTRRDDSELLNNINFSAPLVCVCMGSSGDWEKLSFLKSDQFADICFIVGGDLNRTLDGSNFIHKDFLDLDSVLPKCLLMICHGGNGTIYHGIKNSVYMLCVTSHFEQEWNVYRLEELQLGKCMNDDPVKVVEEHIDHLRKGRVLRSA